MSTWTHGRDSPRQGFRKRRASTEKLNDENITDEEYEHAQAVWEAFGCETLGDYHDLYVETDVTLLADVFENFRNLCQEQYGLDPALLHVARSLMGRALEKDGGRA